MNSIAIYEIKKITIKKVAANKVALTVTFKSIGT